MLVAPEISAGQLTADYENVTHVHALNRIFPSIFEINPNLIVLDSKYLATDMERIVRRIRTNTFYSKIKICCYKNKVEPKADSLLKAIGVDYFIYEEELRAAQKNNSFTSIFTELVDRPVLMAMLINASN